MDRVIANRLLFNIECFYDNTSGVLSISDVALCANVEHCYVCLLTSLSNAFFFLYLRIIRWPQDYFSFIKFCSKVFTRCVWVCDSMRVYEIVKRLVQDLFLIEVIFVVFLLYKLCI